MYTVLIFKLENLPFFIKSDAINDTKKNILKNMDPILAMCGGINICPKTNPNNENIRDILTYLNSSDYSTRINAVGSKVKTLKPI